MPIALNPMNENSNFPLTRISLIERVRDVDGEIRKAALEEFVSGYRPALINFLIKCKQVDPESADDVVQDFLLNKIMNGKVMELAGNKGRFRSLLRACLQNHLIDAVRSKNRQRIQDEIDPVELNELDTNQPDTIDQVWAIAIFREALTSMQNESEYWSVFLDRVLTQPPLPYNQIIEKHGFENPGQASNALMTAKRQFNRILEGVVAKQSYLTDESSSDEVEKEIEFLRGQLLDSDLVGQIIATISDLENCKTDTTDSKMDHSIFGDRLVFVDETPDAQWSKSDIHSLLTHLFEQPVKDFIATDNSSGDTIGELIFKLNSEEGPCSRLQQLKEAFNRDAKTKRSKLPERINVTMTFATIAAFVLAGGEVEAITSMRRDVLISRLQQLTEKDWLPREITELCANSIHSLLK